MWTQDEVRSTILRVESVADLDAEALSMSIIAKHSITLVHGSMAEENVEDAQQGVAIFWDCGSEEDGPTAKMTGPGTTVSLPNPVGDHAKKESTRSQQQRQQQQRLELRSFDERAENSRAERASPKLTAKSASWQLVASSRASCAKAPSVLNVVGNELAPQQSQYEGNQQDK